VSLPVRLAPCSRAHAPEILALFNHAILHTTALYEYEPRTSEFMEGWFDAKERGGWPVIGAFDESGALLGFSTCGPFRPQPGFAATAEHSVYVRGDQQGRGLGKLLLRAIVDAARTRGLHVLMGVIDAENAASVALHRAEGFEHAGTWRQVGFKFGRRLDVVVYQRILAGAA